MNAVTSASSAGASAAVLPAVAAGAAAAGRSFDDVFWHVSGHGLGALVGDTSGHVTGATVATGRTQDSGESPAGAADTVGDDTPSAVGAVPVAVVVTVPVTVPVSISAPPVLAAPMSDASRADTALNTDSAAAVVDSPLALATRSGAVSTRWARSGGGVPTARAGGAAIAVAAPGTTPAAGGDDAVPAAHGHTPVGHSIASGARASATASRSEAAFASIARRTPDTHAATASASGIGIATATASASDADAGIHIDADTDTFAATSADAIADAVADSAAASAADTATRSRADGAAPATPSPRRGNRMGPPSEGWRLDSARPVPAAALGVPPVSPEQTVAPVEGGPSPQATAAAVVAQLMNSAPHDTSRALDLPRGSSRLVQTAPPQGPAPQKPAAEAGTITEAPTEIGAVVVDAIDAVAAGVPAAAASTLAAARSSHPALAAALRAFQQAGVAVAPVTQGAPVAESGAAPVPPALAATLAALAEAPVDARVSVPSTEADRRRAMMPALAMPAWAGELRARAELTSSAPPDNTALPTMAHADGESAHTQIVQSLRVQWTGGAGEAKVRLRPDYLGDVVATIKVDQGTVTATLQADRPEVRQWLEDHAHTLRQALVDHGLKLDRLVVQADTLRGDASDEKQGRPRPRQQQTPQPRPRRQRQAGGGATFELTT